MNDKHQIEENVVGKEGTLWEPKKVAEISICGVIDFIIYENDRFIKPTQEQIKNLKDILCVEVKLFDEKGKQQNER